jgi:hypothetical protein
VRQAVAASVFRSDRVLRAEVLIGVSAGAMVCNMVSGIDGRGAVALDGSGRV